MTIQETIAAKVRRAKELWEKVVVVRAELDRVSKEWCDAKSQVDTLMAEERAVNLLRENGYVVTQPKEEQP